MQLALWEEYADEVEEQMRVLLADNALLQAALADVRSSLSHDHPNSAGTTGVAHFPLDPCSYDFTSSIFCCLNSWQWHALPNGYSRVRCPYLNGIRVVFSRISVFPQEMNLELSLLGNKK